MVNTIQEGIGVKHIRVKNAVLEDGEWWYYGQKDGRRRVSSHVKKNEKRMFVNGKYIKQSHPLYKAGRYKTFEGAAFSSLSGYEKSNEGYVYVITNPCWKGWVKVGMAIDAEDRCKQYQTSSPFRDYTLKFKKYFDDRRSAEQQAHKKIKNICKDNNGEWFKVSISEAKQIIQAI